MLAGGRKPFFGTTLGGGISHCTEAHEADNVKLRARGHELLSSKCKLVPTL